MTRTPRILIALSGVVLAATLLSTSEAQAQYYARPHYRPHARVGVAIYPRGLYLGAGLIGTHILDQRGGDELLDGGGGFTLYTGFRLNRSLALQASWMSTLHNPASVDTNFGPDIDYLVLNGLTADAKVFLGSRRTDAMEPFLQGGVGLYLLDSNYFGTQSVGTGFQLGGGLDVRVGRHVFLGVRALYRGIAMGPPDGGANDTFVSALTADGNLTLQF